MSTVQDNQTVWSVKQNIESKYEKCLNITEEIYKRINITFQIKKLETEAQSEISEHSDHIDSNELSNETDLFACDKSSISSSTEAEKPATKFININNNEEKPKPTVVYKRPRKRFRKKVKKRQSKQQSDSDGSSDEALPLSRIVDIDKCLSEGQESADVMGVPNITILAKDSKPKSKAGDKKCLKNVEEPPATTEDVEKMDRETTTVSENENTDKQAVEIKDDKETINMKNCTMCSLSFRGERGLRRHLAISHLMPTNIKIGNAEAEMKKT